MAVTKDTDRPFHVRTTDKHNFTKGFDTKEKAVEYCKGANTRAEELKITTRYEVVDKPYTQTTGAK